MEDSSLLCTSFSFLPQKKKKKNILKKSSMGSSQKAVELESLREREFSIKRESLDFYYHPTWVVL